jgi:1,2-diacylglycerol 3-alpha-glucosyltransferase
LNATFENSARNLISREVLHKIIYRKLIKKNEFIFNHLYFGSSSSRFFSEENYKLVFNDNDILPLGVDAKHIKKLKNVNNRILNRKKLGIDDSDLVYITGGRLNVEKKVIELLQAFIKLPYDNVKLIVFGEPNIVIRDPLLKLISTDSRILYLGWLSDEDTYNAFVTSDVAIFPGTKSSLWEVATAIGLPLLGRYWPGLEYLDFNGNIVYFEKSPNVNEIFEKIDYVYHNPAELISMKKVAEKFGLKELSYSNVADKILGDYDFIRGSNL